MGSYRNINPIITQRRSMRGKQKSAQFVVIRTRAMTCDAARLTRLEMSAIVRGSR